jgi:hypothetical protein
MSFIQLAGASWRPSNAQAMLNPRVLQANHGWQRYWDAAAAQYRPTVSFVPLIFDSPFNFPGRYTSPFGRQSFRGGSRSNALVD